MIPPLRAGTANPPCLLEKKMPFVIVDPARDHEEQPGFAVKQEIEGWLFTYLLPAATRFTTREEALKCIRTHYKGQKQLTVSEVSK